MEETYGCPSKALAAGLSFGELEKSGFSLFSANSPYGLNPNRSISAFINFFFDFGSFSSAESGGRTSVKTPVPMVLAPLRMVNLCCGSMNI
ncbi:hypothetical protein GCK72_010838 [Caenorhabditis remanei]|uniref:Uncharacterized protein n=1 Tax=Caenorhabditis remanei TaxID=31234 RepID=A0A6A5H6T6_CAERE|nr:hypothetical protein GCK72_010838 [Caenorhabditis remanei]KAF1762576.1 hypothetical protein GCK72_010838 [Caenorhabditis remanei]